MDMNLLFLLLFNDFTGKKKRQISLSHCHPLKSHYFFMLLCNSLVHFLIFNKKIQINTYFVHTLLLLVAIGNKPIENHYHHNHLHWNPSKPNTITTSTTLMEVESGWKVEFSGLASKKNFLSSFLLKIGQ